MADRKVSSVSPSTRDEVEHSLHISLFADLKPEEVQALRRQVGVHLMPPKTVVFQEGDSASSLFIIARGKIDVLTRGDQPSPILLAQLEAGDFFGEISFLTGERRNATILTSTDTLIVEVPYKVLEGLIYQHPLIEKRLSTEESARREDTLRAVKLGVMNRRRPARVELSSPPPCRLKLVPPKEQRSKPVWLAGTARDLSMEGVHIELNQDQLPNESDIPLESFIDLDLTLWLPPMLRTISLQGQIRHFGRATKWNQYRPHMGLQFVKVSEIEKRTLQQFLKQEQVLASLPLAGLLELLLEKRVVTLEDLEAKVSKIQKRS
ncbi:MAG: cyclic nucleotide-binding domain-containing protein [Candidatus Tectomicrobia bacterium]|nr:cyclic nucleotide-binding domain-containing protein [Candidatus Tectomicrobia bacterium]